MVLLPLEVQLDFELEHCNFVLEGHNPLACSQKIEVLSQAGILQPSKGSSQAVGAHRLWKLGVKGTNCLFEVEHMR
jgi:hypothetical protein